MKDRKMKHILIIAVCLMIAVVGCIYELYCMREGVSVEEFLDMGSGREYEEGY